MKTHTIAGAFCALLACAAAAQESGDLRTVAEASDYARTCTHRELLDFLDRLQSAGAPIAVRTIGKTSEERDLALVMVGAPPLFDPARAARRGQPVVYLQANVHAGEVAGKEAVLALLRDLTLGPGGKGGPSPLLDELVLLIVPDYNPDGNDRFASVARNRRGQVGPEQVGTRRNGQGLDLNRDYVKVDSVEYRAVLEHVIRPWDPDLFVDLHTDNGSYHDYELTYAGPLHPLPGEVDPGAWVREHLLPDARRAMREEHDMEVFDFGYLSRRTDPPRWVTFDYRPRFGTNYAGLRGRMAVLVEAYPYEAFRTRVQACYHFVHELLERVAAAGERIRALHRTFDEQVCAWGRDPASAPAPGVAFGLVARGPAEELLLEVLERDEKERRGYRRTGRIEPEPVEVVNRFEPTARVAFPAGYLLPPTMETAVERLRLHGVRVERLRERWEGEVEVFTLRELNINRRAYEGHVLVRSLKGDRERAARELPKGSFYIPTAQALGLLAFYLLEPEYPDSLIAWQVADCPLNVDRPLPYYRIFTPLVAPTSSL